MRRVGRRLVLLGRPPCTSSGTVVAPGMALVSLDRPGVPVRCGALTDRRLSGPMGRAVRARVRGRVTKGGTLVSSVVGAETAGHARVPLGWPPRSGGHAKVQNGRRVLSADGAPVPLGRGPRPAGRSGRSLVCLCQCLG
jgi:hypothetical protein